MNLLELRAVVPGLRTFADGIDPATGATVHTTVYTGHIELVHNRGFRGMIRLTDLQEVSFFVPDSAPYPQPPDALGVELSVRHFRSSGNISAVHLGALDEQVAVVPDPRGGAHQWLQVTFHTPVYSHEQVELNYRVTVQTR